MTAAEQKTCQNCRAAFVIDPEDFDFYKKISVPPPTFCPECRLIRRLSWRNMRSLYKRKCDLCGEEKIGVYSPDKPFRVYCSPCWWSDGWDGTDHGRDYDFSRPFFEQFRELMREAPLIARFVYEDTMVRSDYTNMAGYLKDCYLVFNSGNKAASCERCAYIVSSEAMLDCLDISHASKNELCYYSLDISNSYKLFHSRHCDSCRDSWFLKNCTNCQNCFGCMNLRSKSYCIWNEQYSKEGYEAKLAEMGFDPASAASVERFRKEAEGFWLTAPVKHYHGVHNVNISGDGIYNSKNTKDSFHCVNLEDSRYCAFVVNKVKDCYDWTQYGDGGQLMYETVQGGEGVYNDHFGWAMWRQSKDCEYGTLNATSSDCFGCVGLKNKRFCILNKQYSEEEYRSLRAKIIAHMEEMPYTDANGRAWKYGEFFPYDLAPFGYNESTAQEEFPLEEEEARARGYTWQDTSRFKGVHAVTKPAAELPDRITDAGDDILKEVVGCAVCGRAFRYIPMELAFYRAQNLPLPRLCPECRFTDRHRMRNPLHLWPRKCQCAGAVSESGVYKNTSATHPSHASGEHCPNDFQTAYAPERPEMVYCEQCYNAEVA